MLKRKLIERRDYKGRGWEFKIGEKEISSDVEELANKMSSFKSRPFHKYLLRHKPCIKAVTIPSYSLDDVLCIKFVKLSKDYKTKNMAGRKLSKGWYEQENYDLPRQIIIKLGTDICRVVNELELLSKGQVLKYCSGDITSQFYKDFGFFWIDKGDFSLTIKNVAFGFARGWGYQVPLTLPLSHSINQHSLLEEIEKKDRITHFGDVAIDDLMLAYAVNLNEGVKRFKK